MTGRYGHCMYNYTFQISTVQLLTFSIAFLVHDFNTSCQGKVPKSHQTLFSFMAHEEIGKRLAFETISLVEEEGQRGAGKTFSKSVGGFANILAIPVLGTVS